MRDLHGGRQQMPSSLSALALSAIGIVFGDIGTSPLYTLKTVLSLSGGRLGPEVVLGVLSLVIWTLVMVTTVKYVMVAMRIDNDGEGGILALLSLLGVKREQRPLIVAAGLFGAALIYGDGAITPAISVLSALEGLNLAFPSFSQFVLPTCVAILLGLFLVQRLGTAWIGRLFGPIMVLWFLVIGILGIHGILLHPKVFLALNPIYAYRYLTSSPSAFLVLGGVFLCVTGAEALYADMGHFGPKPIRFTWFGLVFPSLVLSYAGQSALALSGANLADNIFYRLCPTPLLVPLIILATAATIIASQSIITGAFSMTRQAIQLGWMPRMKITQTSGHAFGQVYVGPVNWILMIATIGLAIGFRKSDNLAAAYGIAVSATMFMTSVLLYIAMREIWNWPLVGAGFVALVFCAVDGSFVIANSAKLMEGGYVPLVLAGAVYTVMFIWHKGTAAVSKQVERSAVAIAEFVAGMQDRGIVRVPGSAVFLTRASHGTPPVMSWYVAHSRSLHKRIGVLTVSTASVPWLSKGERLTVEEVAPNFWRLAARYGFMERPNIPALMFQSKELGCHLDLADLTYFVGHETIVPAKGHRRLPRLFASIFSVLQRNSAKVVDHLRLPADQVVEIGRELPI